MDLMPLDEEDFEGGTVERDLEAAHEELEELMAGMDPDTRHEIAQLLDAHERLRDTWGYIQTLLRIARAKSTKSHHAPALPITNKSLLTPVPGGYDIYQQNDYNKVISVLVGSGNTGKQQVKFTAIAGAIAAQADFFKPLCGERWKCGRDGVVELEDYQPENFEMFLAWLYTRDHNMAESLVKIHPAASQIANLYFGKQSHKMRWFQLLHCYFLGDYIGAPQFVNYIADALVLAYKDWVLDKRFENVLDEPVLNSEQVREVVDKNTTESSPLRIMIRDILSPLSEYSSPETISSSVQDHFHHRTRLQNYPLNSHPSQTTPPPYQQAQDTASDNPITHHLAQTPLFDRNEFRNGSLNYSISDDAYTPQTTDKFNTQLNSISNHLFQNHPVPSYTTPSFLNFTYSRPNKPAANYPIPNHAIPSRLQFPQLPHHDPSSQTFVSPHSRPLSRFLFMSGGQAEVKEKSKKYIKRENLKRIWEEPQCKYHVHKRGETCMERK